MLCHRCESFLSNILHQEFVAWKSVQEGWFSFRHGNYASISAAAKAGCDICTLFNAVRHETITDYEGLSEKWHVQAASIDCKFASDYNYDEDMPEHQQRFKWTFYLLTVAPEMSWIAFEIFNPMSGPSIDHEDRSNASEWPLMVSERPFTESMIETAQSWIQRCVDSHTSCARSTRPRLPHRVIDVGDATDRSNPRLQINRGELGKYVTLSHCWGTGKRLTLTKVNLNSFQTSIPFIELPQTFQDAISITKLLGERYIWIDALCIVQDDKEDWRQQSAHMYDIYENATFSMSALSAEDSHSGILHPRNQSQIFGELNDIKFGLRIRLDSLKRALQKSRLETRAWCLQERLLPAAILHIGPDQMYWECHTCTASESFPVESYTQAVHPNSTLLPRPASEWDWRSVVSSYSARDITHASDRFPAIEGLAQKIKTQSGQTYIQGLWSNDLHAGLMWQRPVVVHGKIIPSRDKYAARVSSAPKERPSKAIAASWSWASLNDAVHYPLFESHSVQVPLDSDAFFVIDDRSGGNLRRTRNLQIKALVIRGTCKSPRKSARADCDATFRPSSSSFANEGVDCYLDYIDEPVSRSCYCARIANWKNRNAKSSKRTMKNEKAGYLIFERVENGPSNNAANADVFGTFKRIGMGYDDAAKVDKIFMNAERRIMRLH